MPIGWGLREGTGPSNGLAPAYGGGCRFLALFSLLGRPAARGRRLRAVGGPPPASGTWTTAASGGGRGTRPKTFSWRSGDPRHRCLRNSRRRNQRNSQDLGPWMSPNRRSKTNLALLGKFMSARMLCFSLAVCSPDVCRATTRLEAVMRVACGKLPLAAV